MASRYVVSVYRPGYLPEGDPYSTTDLADAINVWKSEITATIDAGEFLEAHITPHAAHAIARDDLERYGSALYLADGYAHEILRVTD